VLPGVRGDGNQLLQVFFNIVNNAIDAMEATEGGVLTIRTIRDRGNVVILFTDTGPGIKDPQRVFDPFYTTKPVGKGTGLGLSICFGILQEHSGKILCYNSQQGGAVFRVELPAVLAAFPPKEPQLTGVVSAPQKTPV
jgi:two-component system NtrC family sensor kinase